MNPFLACMIGALLAALAWTILVLAIHPRTQPFLGLIGAWAATLVLTALWQAEALPWLRVFLQGVLLVWLGAMALMVTAAVSIWRTQEPGRRPLLGCALLSLVPNLAAGLQFLWLATAAPGGV